ncbi:MAG TPA: SRPBCC domain-containing protein [Patescibacteria group bacterium]|nr:SRPBCC domain-containing protein [Patescibacteria group bacterium]
MDSTSVTISSDAVKAKTGKTWEDWKIYLDKAGMTGKTHKEIVAYLHAKYHLGSWWDQMVTNSYEKMSGRRVVGQTAGTDFQVGVQGIFDISPNIAWSLITSKEASQIWLGHTSKPVLCVKESYITDDGTTGEVRVMEKGSHIRLTWQPKGWKKPSTIQIRIIPQGDSVTIAFHQEGLPGENEREEMKTRWIRVLNKLGKIVNRS